MKVFPPTGYIHWFLLFVSPSLIKKKKFYAKEISKLSVAEVRLE